MAAIIQLPAQSTTRFAAPVADFFALAQPAPELLPEPRPQFRVIEGGRDAARRVRRSTTVYRRRRVTAVLLAAALVLVGSTVGWSVLAREASTPMAPTGVSTDAVVVGPDAVGAAAATPAEVHVVQPGETLWSIAGGVAAGGDIRVVVDQLAEAAGSSTLQAGQRLDLTGIAGG